MDEMKERGALVDEWHAARARIAELEAAIRYVLEDEPAYAFVDTKVGIPRADSKTRAYLRGILDKR